MNRCFVSCHRIILISVLLQAALLASAQKSSGRQLDPLWQKAVTLAAENDGLIPERISEETKAYRSDAQIDQHTISHFEVYTDENKKLQIRLLSSVRDGEDFTAGKQKEMDQQQQRENRFADRKRNIFLPENQDTLVVKRTDRKRAIRGHNCVAMAYTQTLPDFTGKGVVWVEEETGIPYELTTNPDDLPEIKKAKIKNASVTLHYGIREDGRWVLEKLFIQAKVEVKIFVFFTYRGNFQVATTFENHRKLDFKIQ
jgi:hypothetical protein